LPDFVWLNHPCVFFESLGVLAEEQTLPFGTLENYASGDRESPVPPRSKQLYSIQNHGQVDSDIKGPNYYIVAGIAIYGKDK